MSAEIIALFLHFRPPHESGHFLVGRFELQRRAQDRTGRDNYYLDEVERLLRCKAHGCSAVGVKLAMTRTDDTSGFVGGMP